MSIVLDKVKKYWNKQPCNINHSKKKFLSKEYFDAVKKKKIFCGKTYSKICRF